MTKKDEQQIKKLSSLSTPELLKEFVEARERLKSYIEFSQFTVNEPEGPQLFDDETPDDAENSPIDRQTILIEEFSVVAINNIPENVATVYSTAGALLDFEKQFGPLESLSSMIVILGEMDTCTVQELSDKISENRELRDEEIQVDPDGLKEVVTEIEKIKTKNPAAFPKSKDKRADTTESTGLPESVPVSTERSNPQSNLVSQEELDELLANRGGEDHFSLPLEMGTDDLTLPDDLCDNLRITDEEFRNRKISNGDGDSNAATSPDNWVGDILDNMPDDHAAGNDHASMESGEFTHITQDELDRSLRENVQAEEDFSFTPEPHNDDLQMPPDVCDDLHIADADIDELRRAKKAAVGREITPVNIAQSEIDDLIAGPIVEPVAGAEPTADGDNDFISDAEIEALFAETTPKNDEEPGADISVSQGDIDALFDS